MKSISSTQAQIWLKANNIIHEKTELFHVFMTSVFHLIHTTYMGDDVTELDTDKIAHFNWCWNRVLDNFDKEKIHFQRTGEHLEYFWTFFRDAYYLEENKEEVSRVENFLDNIFNLHIKKTKSELDMLGDIYKILEKSLQKLLP
jgi:hypothetical protein